MFENRQEAVEAMMNENIEFRRLYNKHQDLDRQVHNAEAGVTPMDDFGHAASFYGLTIQNNFLSCCAWADSFVRSNLVWIYTCWVYL